MGRPLEEKVINSCADPASSGHVWRYLAPVWFGAIEEEK
jgi:hypothetical protein